MLPDALTPSAEGAGHRSAAMSGSWFRPFRYRGSPGRPMEPVVLDMDTTLVPVHWGRTKVPGDVQGRVRVPSARCVVRQHHRAASVMLRQATPAPIMPGPIRLSVPGH
jgi:hypothetical protein